MNIEPAANCGVPNGDTNGDAVEAPAVVVGGFIGSSLTSANFFIKADKVFIIGSGKGKYGPLITFTIFKHRS